jgi:hypothetical protein
VILWTAGRKLELRIYDHELTGRKDKLAIARRNSIVPSLMPVFISIYNYMTFIDRKLQGHITFHPWVVHPGAISASSVNSPSPQQA